MCKYFGYFLSVWALGLGTFYAYMLYDIIQSIRSLSGPLGAFQSLMGPSSGGLGGLGAGLAGLNAGQHDGQEGVTKSPASTIDDVNKEIDSSMKAIYALINENMNDEKKRLQYLREFLPDTGLEEKHFTEMNAIMDNFEFEKLKEYLDQLTTYVNKNVKDKAVLEKTIAKLEEFKANSANIDESLENLAAHISKQEL
ncbi:hypothetical protein M3Y97_00736500 [Aphelenchoides bicaudatus]|nr:hypothetical protein M3Y97_00736500 [Aphelenchoides bicaudatus]